jgi:ADP-glucose pyrophosphorylase
MIFTINHDEVPPAGTRREKIEETFLSQPCYIKNDRTKKSAIFSTPVPVATGANL